MNSSSIASAYLLPVLHVLRALQDRSPCEDSAVREGRTSRQLAFHFIFFLIAGWLEGLFRRSLYPRNNIQLARYFMNSLEITWSVTRRLRNELHFLFSMLSSACIFGMPGAVAQPRNDKEEAREQCHSRNENQWKRDELSPRCE